MNKWFMKRDFSIPTHLLTSKPDGHCTRLARSLTGWKTKRNNGKYIQTSDKFRNFAK